MSDVCGQLGVPFTTDETEGPSTKLTFLEILIDAELQTLSLAAGKVKEISVDSKNHLYSYCRAWSVNFNSQQNAYLPAVYSRAA